MWRKLLWRKLRGESYVAKVMWRKLLWRKLRGESCCGEIRGESYSAKNLHVWIEAKTVTYVKNILKI